MGDASLEPGEPPDPAALAKLEAAAKKYKFANYDEFNTVRRQYRAGARRRGRQDQDLYRGRQGAETGDGGRQGRRQNVDSDKQEALAEIAEEMKNVTPVKFPGNIELVVKHYDALVAEETGQKL